MNVLALGQRFSGRWECDVGTSWAWTRDDGMIARGDGVIVSDFEKSEAWMAP